MNNPNLYARKNALQRRDVKDVTDEFSEFFNEKCERVLDIGTGTGDVLRDFIAPRLNPTAEIIGMDVSEQMVGYATRNNGGKNVKFVLEDIEDRGLVSDGGEVFRAGTFDLVTSFFALNHVPDQE
jgi:juvenile hormone-III synthase